MAGLAFFGRRLPLRGLLLRALLLLLLVVRMRNMGSTQTRAGITEFGARGSVFFYLAAGRSFAASVFSFSGCVYFEFFYY